MPNWSTSFQLPNVPYEKKLEYCLRILKTQRLELIPLRKKIAICKLQSARWEDLMRHWREKYEGSQEELERIKKENETLKKEKEKLEKEIEKLTKTAKRYQVALFDHGNFKHNENIEKKFKGGQKGHGDTNRENQGSFEGYEMYPRKRIYALSCRQCGTALNRAKAFKQKVLIDIVLKPELVKLILESERQWCSNCREEVISREEQSLPFTEYGLNIFMMVLVLRFKGHLSISAISSVLSIANGLKVSASAIANMLRQASCFLDTKYKELIQSVRKGAVMYADETGWIVRKQKAWLWIMANEKTTVYYAAESRGKGVAESMYGDSRAYLMTDGFASYAKTTSIDKHLYCWSHILRFAYEETVQEKKTSKACFLRDELVRIYHIKKKHPEYDKDKLERALQEEFKKLLNLKSESQAFIKIQNRARDQKEGLILALVTTKDGTNNLSERELRPMILNRHISYGSDTYSGMENQAILASIMQTISKKEDLLSELQLLLQIGIHEKNPQYSHIVYSDT